MIARSTPWGTIQFGEGFYLLTELEQRAVIAHEKGHIHHGHALKRLWWVITLRAALNWEGFLAMCEAQELEADQYALDHGHFAGLYYFLYRQSRDVKYPGYPSIKERLEALHV